MLTQRRKEFLDRIRKLYQETGDPVHYHTVAENLHVSKWTAYDMLKELERQGYVRGEYVVNADEKNPGRSMIVFHPTEQADEVFAGAGETGPEEWHRTKERLLERVEGFRQTNLRSFLKELNQEMAQVDVPLIFCAYTIVTLLISSQTISKPTLEIIRNLVTLTPRPDLGLAMFAGTLVGICLNTAGNLALRGRIASYVDRYQKHLAEIRPEEKHQLLDFLKEVLNRA